MSETIKFTNNVLFKSNIDVLGTVDGRNITTDGALLDSHTSASSGIHGITGSIVGTTDTQILTNKTISSGTNTIGANELRTTGSSVVIDSAAPPTTGQILKATSSTTATWQDETGGSGEINTASNVGYTSGGALGLFKQKTGTDLEFYKLDIGSNKLSLILNTTNGVLDYNLVESNIIIGNLSGAPSSTVVGISDTQTLTNKSIDADNNTITNIENTDIKAGAAIDATKIADGSVTSTEFQYINTLSSNVQTQIDNHTGDDTIHRIIDDSSTSGTVLWSGNKIDSEIDSRAGTDSNTLFSYINSSVGNADHIHVRATTDTNSDDYNLNIDITDETAFIVSSEDFTYRQATVMSADASGGNNTIFGISSSNDSGSSWTPGLVVTQDRCVGIGKHSPTDTLDVAGNIVVSGTVDGRDVATDGTNQDNHIAATSAHGVSGNIVGTTDTQTLTNKSIDADNNTITNIDNTDIKAGAAIDASKIANGTVSNTEFQYINSLTSNAQTQIDNHLSDTTTHGVSGNIVGTTDTQTLTNKTLTTPIISIISNTGTITLPTSTDTLVGRATTDTLTNKTFGDDLDMNNNKITNLTTPTADSDAANKSYVDGVASGLDVKNSVVATDSVDLDSNASISGTITYNNTAGTSGRGQITATLVTTDTFTIDGVTFGAAENGARILLKDQTSGAQNGIWTTTVSGTSLTLDRATDFDSDSEVTSGAFTFVEEGTIHADCGFVLSTNDPIIIGGASGTALVFGQFSGTGQITAGTGLTKSGSIINAGGSTTIIANADDLEVNSSSTANQILLSSGSVGTAATFGSLPLGNTDSVSGTLAVANGGTGTTTHTSGNFLQGNGTSAITATKSVPTGDVIGSTDTQTLTNKTISAGSNTITGLASSDVGLGNVQNTKVKLDATTAPTSSNDTGEGYSIGSKWVDITNDKSYICVDVTASNAVWLQTSNLQSYDAVVDASGNGDYTSVASAFSAGHKTVFVRDGSYNETADIEIPSGGGLYGESMNSTAITMSGSYSVKCDGSGGTKETAGTISITHDTTAVTGSGTTFTNLNPLGSTFIIIEQNAYPVTSVTDNTNLTIGLAFHGNTISGGSYIAQKMNSSIVARNFTIIGSTIAGMYLRAIRHAVFTDIVCRNCTPGVEILDGVNNNFTSIMCQNSGGHGYHISDLNSCVLDSCQSFNSALNGINIVGASRNICVDSTQGSNSVQNGLVVGGTSTNIGVSNCIFNNNKLKGIDVLSGAGIVIISGTHLRYNGSDGIDFDGLDNIISGCVIYKNGGHGIQAGINGVISGNQINMNTGNGINMNGDYQNSVNGNRITNGSGHGIWLDSHRNVIDGNFISGNASDGIHITTGDNNSLSNNIVYNNTGTGIKINAAGATNNQIINNQVYSNTTAQYTDSGTSTILVKPEEIVLLNDSQTLTNKTIDADNNTITNIDNADIKAGAAIDATKIADGSVTNTEFQYINTVTSNVQTQLNGKAATSHFHDTSDITTGTFADARIAASNVTQHEGSITIGNLIGAPSSTVVGISDTQTLTNKTFGDVVNINSTTQSFDTTTGALIVDGGVGIAKNLNIGGIIGSNTSSSGYVLDVHNTKADGGNGFLIRAGEIAGDIAFKISDRDETFAIMEMEANNGYITTHKTYAQTLADNGIVYGFDNQHSGVAKDFNTQFGIYRMGGVDVANVAQTLTNKTITSTTNNVTSKSLHSATTVVDVSAATAPTSGQILTATSGTAATWQTPSVSVFGSEYQYSEDEDESNTTSTSYETKVTFTTGSLPSGNYRIDYTSEVSSNSAGIAHIKVDVSGTDIAEYSLENDNDWPALGGFKELNLSGVKTITMKYKINSSSYTCKVRKARICLYRVS